MRRPLLVDPVNGMLTAFMPAPDNSVLSLAVNSASPLLTLYAGGSFLNMGSTARTRELLQSQSGADSHQPQQRLHPEQQPDQLSGRSPDHD